MMQITLRAPASEAGLGRVLDEVLVRSEWWVPLSRVAAASISPSDVGQITIDSQHSTLDIPIPTPPRDDEIVMVGVGNHLDSAQSIVWRSPITWDAIDELVQLVSDWAFGLNAASAANIDIDLTTWTAPVEVESGLPIAWRPKRTYIARRYAKS